MLNISSQPITSVLFDRGSRPAARDRIILFNSTNATFDTVIPVANITIALPYDADAALVVKPYQYDTHFHLVTTLERKVRDASD
jgi:hypothetical protein